MKQLLLVEDHFPDVKVIQRALRSLTTPHHVHLVQDGEAALSFLQKKAGFTGTPVPDLILLDLNLPKVTGYDVLLTIKKLPDIQRIPVIVMSGSEAPNDINFSYAAGCAAYVVKPGSPDNMVRLVEAIERIWFTLGRTPTP